MHLKRKSEYVAQVMREIRQAALDEENEKLRGKLWRWYYRLQHGEDEIRAMVMDSEMRHILEYIIAHGMLPANWKEELAELVAKIEADREQQQPLVDDGDDDIPPRQLRLWD